MSIVILIDVMVLMIILVICLWPWYSDRGNMVTVIVKIIHEMTNYRAK